VVNWSWIYCAWLGEWVGGQLVNRWVGVVVQLVLRWVGSQRVMDLLCIAGWVGGQLVRCCVGGQWSWIHCAALIGWLRFNSLGISDIFTPLLGGVKTPQSEDDAPPLQFFPFFIGFLMFFNVHFLM